MRGDTDSDVCGVDALMDAHVTHYTQYSTRHRFDVRIELILMPDASPSVESRDQCEQRQRPARIRYQNYHASMPVLQEETPTVHAGGIYARGIIDIYMR